KASSILASTPSLLPAHCTAAAMTTTVGWVFHRFRCYQLATGSNNRPRCFLRCVPLAGLGLQRCVLLSSVSGVLLWRKQMIGLQTDENRPQTDC
ncbi:unnamed protein product, partial [Ectocarpus sp. 12 AP-2014]